MANPASRIRITMASHASFSNARIDASRKFGGSGEFESPTRMALHGIVESGERHWECERYNCSASLSATTPPNRNTSERPQNRAEHDDHDQRKKRTDDANNHNVPIAIPMR